MVYFNEKDYNSDFSPYKVEKGDIVIAMSGATTGKIGVHKSDALLYLNQRVGKFIPLQNMLLNRYLFHFIQTKIPELLRIATGGGAQPNISSAQIKNIIIPLPPLKEQERIVSILDKFEKLTNDLSEGLPAEIKARRQQYEYYRDKLLTFNKIAS